MASRILILVSLFAATIWLQGQSAEDYFHRSAQHYVFNEKQKARTEVEAGLRKFPGDPKLSTLAGLLEEEEHSPPESQTQQNESEQQEQDSTGSSQQQESDQDQQQAEEQEQEQEQSGDEGDEEGEESPAIPAGQMTLEQAQQLLEAQRQDERTLIFRPEAKPRNPGEKLKDW